MSSYAKLLLLLCLVNMGFFIAYTMHGNFLMVLLNGAAMVYVGIYVCKN